MGMPIVPGLCLASYYTGFFGSAVLSISQIIRLILWLHYFADPVLLITQMSSFHYKFPHQPLPALGSLLAQRALINIRYVLFGFSRSCSHVLINVSR